MFCNQILLRPPPVPNPRGCHYDINKKYCPIFLIFDYVCRVSTTNQVSPFPRIKAKYYLFYPQNLGPPKSFFAHCAPEILQYNYLYRLLKGYALNRESPSSPFLFCYFEGTVGN